MNAMRPILLAALFGLPLPLAAQTLTAESFMSAAKLKQVCAEDTADNPVSSTFVCIGYIMGVVDTLASLKAWDQAECLLALPRDLGTIAMTATNGLRPRNFVVAQAFLPLVALIGRSAVFWILAVICIVAALFIQFLVPETKGRSLKQIETTCATGLAPVAPRP